MKVTRLYVYFFLESIHIDVDLNVVYMHAHLQSKVELNPHKQNLHIFGFEANVGL